ncbi:MAG: ypmQ 2 [Verrucomicrobiales bacterium]|nr:ypmQ 2 [Verrucomicrobiales bacterium]
MRHFFEFKSLSKSKAGSLLAIASTGLSLAVATSGRAEDLVTVLPSKINAAVPALMKERRMEQEAAAKNLGAFHDFHFTDKRVESGITFQHHVVDDAGKTWKPAHYDHGTGLAVADVDGDGLLDMYFVNQLGGSELWRNLGNGKFENITAKAGVALADKICVAAAFADIDNDGLPDLFVTTVRGGNFLFKNLGKGVFKDISKEAGVDYVGHSSGAVFFDFDRDGLLDLFVANIGTYTSNEKGKGGFYRALDDAFVGHLTPGRFEQSLLYKNMGGGKFKLVSKEMNLQHKAWSGDASFCDLKETGYPELYVLTMQGDNKFYENRGGKSFRENTAAYFPKTPWGAMGIKFFDYNNDGRMDLLITDMHSDMTQGQTTVGKTTLKTSFEKEKSDVWCAPEWGKDVLQGRTNQNIFGNAFYENQGNGNFVEKSGPLGLETYWPWGVTVADFNADSFQDVFVTAGMGYPFRYSINSLLLNDGGKKFYDAEFLVGIEPPSHLEKEYFVLDCDGEDKGHPLVGRHHGKLSVTGSISSRSSAVFDLNQDGALDLVVNQMNDYPQILISDLAQKKKIHYLNIKLVGTKSNRDGLGATVRVTAGGKILTQFHDGKSGYLSQSLIPLYFGLGETEGAEKIEIVWPSGIKQTMTKDIPKNTLITIKETE